MNIELQVNYSSSNQVLVQVVGDNNKADTAWGLYEFCTYFHLHSFES